jgi:3-deoxy-D-arabino-heptulosonate 7-phosphate (DAHP) synthase
MAFATIESGADGIMLEVHLNPKKSDVDSLQPINYKDFKNIFKK